MLYKSPIVLQSFAQADSPVDPGAVVSTKTETVQVNYEVDHNWNPFNGGSLLPLVVPLVILTLVAMAGLAKIFQKAGKPMWWAFVPVFNLTKIFELLGKPAWWGLLVLGSTIPYAGWGFLAGALVLLCLADIDLGRRFGKSTGWSVGFLAILGFIGTPILGFGKAKYNPNAILQFQRPPLPPHGPQNPAHPMPPAVGMPPSPTVPNPAPAAPFQPHPFAPSQQPSGPTPPTVQPPALAEPSAPHQTPPPSV